MGDEFGEFLRKKAQEIHEETWSTFRAGMIPSASYHCAKDKEKLIGEILREYEYYR
jgi:hypothetical protein